MATISINVPDQELDRVVSALCEYGLYSEVAEEGETPPQFAKGVVTTFIKSVVRTVERRAAEAEALSSIVDSPDVPLS